MELVLLTGAVQPTTEVLPALGLLPHSVTVLPFLDQETLAASYRRAALTVLTSDAEDFGLPVLESMACGTPVVVSDIPVLREVSGEQASYCRVANIAGWANTILNLLAECEDRPSDWAERRAAGVRWSRRFTWNEYARRAVELYRNVACGLAVGDSGAPILSVDACESGV